MIQDEPLTKDDRSHIRKYGLHSWALHAKLSGLNYGTTGDRDSVGKFEANDDLSGKRKADRAEIAWKG